MGLLHLLLLRRLAVPVLAVDPLAERREIAQSLGADAVLHPADETMTDTIRELSGGAGAQAIFVTAGGQAQNACMEQAVKLAAKKAIVVSFASSTATEDARLDQNRIHYSMLEVRGVVGFYPRHLDQAIELLHAGSIDPAAIRRPRMSLADIGRAFDMYGAPGTLKIGIDVDASSP
jgi:threonine dehydrogenase-like Zn-dependent dehydrogenase